MRSSVHVPRTADGSAAAGEDGHEVEEEGAGSTAAAEGSTAGEGSAAGSATASAGTTTAGSATAGEGSTAAGEGSTAAARRPCHCPRSVGGLAMPGRDMGWLDMAGRALAGSRVDFWYP